MPGGLSVKLAGVLAAFAFAGAFRVEASRSDPAEPAAPIRSARTQAALASDVAPALAAGLPRLSRVPGLPSLRKAPARPRHRAKPPVSIKAAAPVVPAAPTPVATAPPVVHTAPPAPPKKSYVGKSFDTSG
jgi:hypothetical protein